MDKDRGFIFGLIGTGVWTGFIAGLLIGYDHIPDPVGVAVPLVVMIILFSGWHLYRKESSTEVE